MSRKGLLLWSLGIAVLAASTRWSVQALTGATFTFVLVSAVLAVFWHVLLIVSVHRYGKDGLWVVLGAPLALFWPIWFGLLWYACEHGADCM